MCDEKIKKLVQYAWCLIGTPYKFGGNSTNQGGLDCSAFVLEILRAAGFWGPSDASSQMILNKFNQLESDDIPEKWKPMTMRFYGKDRHNITHVDITIDSYHCIEAGGNDLSGMIRLRPNDYRIKYAKDFIAKVELYA
jgi:cell wall-associated NlpC family hydrolase